MRSYKIVRRPRSEANYVRYNPNGDPFTIRDNLNPDEKELYGLGMGLFWGEGNKADKCAVRLGNSDPYVILTFVKFLEIIFCIDKNKLRYHLQIFTDINPEEAHQFWLNILKAQPSQFYKDTVTISGAIGTYRKKSKYGVLTVYFHNKKLRDVIIERLKLMKNMPR